MQTFQELFNNLLNDIRVELNDEFDRNFERKAFFNTAWKPATKNSIGSLMMRTGALRKSIFGENTPIAEISGTSIKWSSSLPYADIHNSGGTITVTPKMKGFFWYRYKLATGSMQTTKKGKQRSNKFNRALSAEAEFWKAMALKAVGSQIIIPKRQFIGDHTLANKAIEEVTTEWFNDDVKKHIDIGFNNLIKK